MKSLLENTRILVLITALFGMCVILVGRTDILPFNSLFIGGMIFLLVVGTMIYRPAYGFALFVAALPFEIITVFPEHIGFSVRPYQILGVVLCVVILWSLIRKKVTDTRVYVIDALMIGLLIVSGATVQWAYDPSVALRQAIIFASFVVLYFVVRFFIAEYQHVIKILPIVIVSGWVTSLYAITQNILFLYGGDHQEFMPGRPNAFFAEPDWLGIYLVFVFAACVAFLYYNAHHRHAWRFFDVTLWGITTTVVVAMILTVARSAWLGAAAVSVLYVLVVFALHKYKTCARHVLWIGSVVVGSVLIVGFLPVTNFELDNRVQSTATGLQEITVSCTQKSAGDQLVAQGTIDHVSELAARGCRHINLEEIDAEKAKGYSVVMVLRDDPNVVVRAQTYYHVIQLIRERPLTGYGWGSSGALLGTDEQGTPLNASNIFLEVILSIGMIGGGLFFLIFGVIGVRAIMVLRHAHDEVTRSVALFGLLGLVAIVVPNFFNAGLFLGFVWAFMGMVAILCKKV